MANTGTYDFSHRNNACSYHYYHHTLIRIRDRSPHSRYGLRWKKEELIEGLTRNCGRYTAHNSWLDLHNATVNSAKRRLSRADRTRRTKVYNRRTGTTDHCGVNGCSLGTYQGHGQRSGIVSRKQKIRPVARSYTADPVDFLQAESFLYKTRERMASLERGSTIERLEKLRGKKKRLLHPFLLAW